jgi:Holliday junction resolvase RusA-like endonuclease
MVKHKATYAYRYQSCVLGLLNGRKPIVVPVLAILPITTTRRRRDIDNVLAALKAALDGLTDAGWWKDDSDIVGITIRKPLYIPKSGEDRIIIVADESCNEDRLIRMIQRQDPPFDGSSLVP